MYLSVQLQSSFAQEDPKGNWGVQKLVRSPKTDLLEENMSSWLLMHF